MAKGVFKTDGVKSDYAKLLIEQAEDQAEYEKMYYDQSLLRFREMTDDEKQAAYIKLHWDLCRFTAMKRDKYDRKWRRVNASLMLKAEQEGLLLDGKETSLVNFLSANLTLQECISNISFWAGKAAMHSNVIATEKNARDLLGILYPGEHD